MHKDNTTKGVVMNREKLSKSQLIELVDAHDKLEAFWKLNIESLQDRIEKLEGALKECEADNTKFIKANADVGSFNIDLIDWIVSSEHGGHKRDCHVFYMPKETCTCGLDNLLNRGK